MENTKYIEEKLKEFDDNFVHMGILNDMHNRPILYEMKFDDINEIKSFLKFSLSQALEHGYTQGKKDTVEKVVREIEIFRFSVPVGEGTFTTLYCPDCKEQAFTCKHCLVNSLKR